MSSGLLLVNLGTPRSPAPSDVGAYLREFLMDPLVIDLPWVLRYPLVHFGIVPGRSVASGKLYDKVWRPEGSPLIIHGRELAEGVRRCLPGVPVALAMRYGEPTIAQGMEALRGLDRVVVLPLYPHYSLAATESSKRAVARSGFSGELIFIAPFYKEEGFLAAFTDRIAQTLGSGPWDRLIFSYHGLPERQVKRTAPTACSFDETCCAAVTEKNRDCYRAQCYETSRGLAGRLGVPPEKTEVAFQSRLGRTPWIRPYTDELYLRLAKEGVKRLVVASPSFVADCLETLEEIAIRGRESFLGAGGESLRLVPSLNGSGRWAETVAALYRRHAGS